MKIKADVFVSLNGVLAELIEVMACFASRARCVRLAPRLVHGRSLHRTRGAGQGGGQGSFFWSQFTNELVCNTNKMLRNLRISAL